MSERMIIKDFIKSDLAVTSDKAAHVFDYLSEKIKKNEPVLLDFTGISVLTTAFLNIAIGELYLLGSPEDLNKFIKFDPKTISNLQYSKIKLVMQNSKEKMTPGYQERIDEVTLNG